MRKKILIFYNYYLPAFRAGGPIRSLSNLINSLYDEYDFFVVTTNKELGQKKPLNVVPNEWINFDNTNVIYLSDRNTKYNVINKIIRDVNPDKIFVNGVYSFSFSILPALFFPRKTIMHVRGMLLPGALKQHSIKKRLFLSFFKFLGIQNKIVFCVSDEREMKYTKTILGDNISIKIAQNIPTNLSFVPTLIKENGQLKLISISLISSMKNHELVLDALSLVKTHITWHIYGPIKDVLYWNRCKMKIDNLPRNIDVQYMGELNPSEVCEKLSFYHFFILPSESENFGHALYESLIAGKPIITSHFTPWNFLEKNNAGFNVDLNPVSLAIILEECALMDHNNYSKKSNSAREFALNSINLENIKQQYFNLFGK